MQFHFDHTCLAWYPNLNKSLKKNKNTPEEVYLFLFELE